jgi:hypothetical protein
VVVSSPQHGETTTFFSSFPLGGIHAWGILLVIPLAFQGIKHQPFSMTQPFAKVSSRPLPKTAGTEDFNVFSRWLNPSCLNSSSPFSSK